MKYLKNFLYSVIISFMIAVVLFAFSILASVARADFKVFNLNELSIDYKNYKMVNPNSRNMLIYPEHPKEAINVNVNIDLLKYCYWDSIIESLTTEAQYKSIGLQTRTGCRIFNSIELGVYHHSQHILDGKSTYMWRFPEEDAVQLKIYLYKQEKRESIF